MTDQTAPCEAVAWLTTGGDVTRSHAFAVEQSVNDPENFPVALYARPTLPEGWVAEPTPEFLEPFARRWCVDNGIDPDEPAPPHGEWPRWYDECSVFAAMYRDIAKAMLSALPLPFGGGEND